MGRNHFHEQIYFSPEHEIGADNGHHDGSVANYKRHEESRHHALEVGKYIVRGMDRARRKDKRPKTKFKKSALFSD